ncbi:unnamed protein product [Cochlearia groenlandica]
MRKGAKRKVASKSSRNGAKARGRKRKGTTKKEDEKKPADPITKKRRVAKPKEEPEYFEEKRPLEDLWKVAFPVGTEWDQLDSLYEFNWDFKNLEEAFEEEGLLYGKKVFVFGCTGPQLVPYKGLNKIVLVPAIVAVESPFPPSDKIGIKSVQREVEEIIPMKKMKMDWLPYISFEKRDRQIDRMNFKIFTLGCTLRRSALRHMKEDQVKKFEYCLPYFYQPFTEDELEESTVVQIMFPSEPPVVCEFDWEHDELDGPENFVDKLIEEEALAAEEKDEFKEFVKEQVRAAKRANREAREARSRARNEMSAETRQAFQSMKFYKFYPRLSPDTPDVSGVKSPFINRYYGKAHQVL